MPSKIKKILKEIAIFGIIVFIAANVMSYLRAPKLQSDTLPDLSITLIDGEKFDVTRIKGKPLLVHFWATWCPVCKAEISNIQRVSTHYEVLSIAVNSGSDEALQEYIRKEGYDFKVYNDDTGSLAHQFKVGVFPTTFIYDANGRVKFTEVGYTTTAGLLARIELLK